MGGCCGFAAATIVATAAVFGWRRRCCSRRPAGLNRCATARAPPRTGGAVRGTRCSWLERSRSRPRSCSRQPCSSEASAHALGERRRRRRSRSPLTVQLPSSAYRDWAAVDRFYDALLTAVRSQPGVERAGATTTLPVDASWRLSYLVDGRPAPRPGEESIAQHISVTSGYFETFKARLIAGRFFDATDTATSEPVIVVNESFAHDAFPGQAAVGQRILSTATNIGPLGMNTVGRGRSGSSGSSPTSDRSRSGRRPSPSSITPRDSFRTAR